MQVNGGASEGKCRVFCVREGVLWLLRWLGVTRCRVGKKREERRSDEATARGVDVATAFCPSCEAAFGGGRVGAAMGERRTAREAGGAAPSGSKALTKLELHFQTSVARDSFQ